MYVFSAKYGLKHYAARVVGQHAQHEVTHARDHGQQLQLCLRLPNCGLAVGIDLSKQLGHLAQKRIGAFGSEVPTIAHTTNGLGGTPERIIERQRMPHNRSARHQRHQAPRREAAKVCPL
jgi:hypothetical protein